MPDGSLPGPGHNRPPSLLSTLDAVQLRGELVEEFSHLTQRSVALQAAFERWLLRFPAQTLETAEEQGLTADFVRQVKDHLALIEECRDQAQRPVRNARDTIQAFFNGGMADQLTADVQVMTKALTAFLNHQRDVATAKARAERAAELAAAAKAAEAAAAKGDHQALDAAVEAEQRALEKPITVASTRSHGESSQVGLTGRWKVRIVNPDQIPRQYLTPNLQMMEAAMQASRLRKGPPTLAIPGVEFFLETKANVR